MLTSSASLQLSGSEFQTLDALMQTTFINKIIEHRVTVSKFLSEDCSDRAKSDEEMLDMYDCLSINSWYTLPAVEFRSSRLRTCHPSQHVMAAAMHNLVPS